MAQAPASAGRLGHFNRCGDGGSIVSRPLMPAVFWFGLGIAAFGAFVGLVSGARSTSTATLTGLAIGAFMGMMAGFPLLAIGLATS